ncbi:uncharacterized protein LOC127855889 [Dreissena polymorpha]|uniref:uncharacterized protein LOC127855889 n=1 Tax=Dreissena polymorpha TaxID=45954 RepID=UPI00226433EA|nr:uncharacterized protein LOC127855889 [Dreissena polymorpha]
MAYARFLVQGCIELVIIIAICPKDGIFYEKIASTNDTNVDLVFEFNKPRHIFRYYNVYKNSARIGRCMDNDAFIELPNCYTSDSAKFKLSANVSIMVVLTLGILFFNESMTGNYSCTDSYKDQEQTIIMSTPVNLTSVLLTPNAQTFPKYNEPSIYTCITSTTKPGAAIHWFEDVHNITDMSISTYDSYISTSVLRYLPMVKRETNVSCVAMYKYREHDISITKSTKVCVQFPVSTPTVSINDVNVSGTITVLEGEMVRFICFSDGFPTPSYNWNFKGHITDGQILELKIKRTENGSALRCSVSNVLLTINGSRTATSYTHWVELILQVLCKAV